MIRNLIKKIDHKLFFPYLRPPESRPFYLYKKEASYKFLPDHLLKNTPDEIKQYFEFCANDWTLEQFHFLYTKGCTIEPSIGWGITKKNKLIPESLWYNYVDKVNKPSFFKYMLKGTKKQQLKEAVSIHYAWRNYWHFYNDIIGQIHLADKAGLPEDIPVIIGAGLAQQKYFRDILALSPQLQKRNWILQDKNTKIYCNKVHFFNTYWGHRENFDAVLDYINFQPNHTEQLKDFKKIFIIRTAGRGRTLINQEEVNDILKKYDFKIVECDNLSVTEQINIFQNAEYVIGIHGAGLTNIIFRKTRPLKVLEILSKSYLNPCYYWLCAQYHFDYYAVLGSEYKEKNTTAGSFYINIGVFEKRLIGMLS